MRKNNDLMLIKTVEKFQNEHVLFFIIHLLNLLVHMCIAESGSFASVQQIYVNLILRRTQTDICLIQS